jgi:hypothetical protein
MGHGNIMGISWEYYRNIMGISWEYHGNIIGKFIYLKKTGYSTDPAEGPWTPGCAQLRMGATKNYQAHGI